MRIKLIFSLDSSSQILKENEGSGIEWPAWTWYREINLEYLPPLSKHYSFVIGKTCFTPQSYFQFEDGLDLTVTTDCTSANLLLATLNTYWHPTT